MGLVADHFSNTPILMGRFGFAAEGSFAENAVGDLKPRVAGFQDV